MAGSPGANPEFVAWLAPEAPAGTPATSPVKVDVGIGTAFVWRFEVRIPPGHAGYTGLALVDSGSFVVPFAQPGPAWLVGDDDLLEYPVEREVGTSLQVWCYNTSSDYPHGWQVRIVYTPVSAFEAETSVMVTPDIAVWLEEVGGGSA